MILQETYKLENGTKIPKLGLGTWCIDNDKACLLYTSCRGKAPPSANADRSVA